MKPHLLTSNEMPRLAVDSKAGSQTFGDIEPVVSQEFSVPSGRAARQHSLQRNVMPRLLVDSKAGSQPARNKISLQFPLLSQYVSRAVWCLLVIGLASIGAHGGEVIDRIVASVNGHVVLQSDWDEAVCYEALNGARDLQQITAADRKAALDRLIDQELLREQIRGSELQAGRDELQKGIQEIQSRYPDAQSEAGWQAVLARYHLSPGQVESHIAVQLQLTRLVDARLRPTIQVDSRSIESYYQQTLIPQLRHTGAREVPLAEVTPRIKELLTQEKMNQLLLAWLQNLRAESRIRTPGLSRDNPDAGESR